MALPEIVIVPAHPAKNGEGYDVVFEVREGPGSAPVLPVFSTIGRLVEALGHAQPWLALPLRTARELAARGGVHEVELDPAVQAGSWRWQIGDLQTLEGSLE